MPWQLGYPESSRLSGTFPILLSRDSHVTGMLIYLVCKIGLLAQELCLVSMVIYTLRPVVGESNINSSTQLMRRTTHTHTHTHTQRERERERHRERERDIHTHTHTHTQREREREREIHVHSEWDLLESKDVT